jgi:pimeloyl-ACP methyl ester carboxylesterase
MTIRNEGLEDTTHLTNPAASAVVTSTAAKAKTRWLEAEFNTLRLASSRILAWSEFGCPDGLPVLFFHSNGSSRLEASLFHEQAKQSGLRLIAVDRPGIGKSEFCFSSTPEPFGHDLVELLDHLALTSVSTLTLGHGAVYALALARLDPARIKGQISLGAIPCGPLHTSGAGGLRPWMNKGVATLVRHGWTLRELFDRKTTGNYIDTLRRELCKYDRRALNSSELRRILVLDRREALSQGSRGVAQDESMGFAPFDYQLAKLTLDVDFWQGRGDDERVGRSSVLLAQQLPKGRAHIVTRQGYFFFLENATQILNRCSTTRLAQPAAIAA